MAVFTRIDKAQLEDWLSAYPIGQLLSFEAIASGVTNSNYKIVTTQGQYVLTLFEVLSAAQLPYYINLLVYLSQHGVAVAAPVPNVSGSYIDHLAEKATCLCIWLEGTVIEQAQPSDCWAVGQMLARLHAVGQNYPASMQNPRGAVWREMTAQRLYPQLSAELADLLRTEMAYQSTQALEGLPSGVIHADLFRDNVLVTAHQHASFIDFYYACNDSFLYDVAITLNDWCMFADSAIDGQRAVAFLRGYQSVRPLTVLEKKALPAMLRVAAMRFWLSRFDDWLNPPPNAFNQPKDPAVFQRMIQWYRHRDDCAAWLVQAEH